MKLISKLLIITGLTWAIFLAITSFNFIRYPWVYYTITTILLFSFTFLCFKQFIFKRLTLLNQILKEMIESKIYSPLPQIQGKDEIATLANYINHLIEAYLISQTHLKQQIVKSTQELQDKNIQLQKEISERMALQKKITADDDYLTKVARYDELTSLPNRFFFNEIINNAISHVRRRQKLLAILLINLDNFKQVNIQLGYQQASEVLKTIAQRFFNMLRSDDVIAKLDGDEFIVLLNDIGQAKFASVVAEKLLQVCAQPIEINFHKIVVTASIGICIYPNDGNSLEQLLKNTDQALYQAKHHDKNTYQFYTPEMNIEAKEYIKLETALRSAIANHELTLYYQPRLRLKKGTIIGIEALLRWEHPTLGLVSPEKFITVAEETGLIHQLGQWVLTEACKMNKYWQDEGYEHMTIAVNLSATQFHHPDIAKVVNSVLEQTGLNPRYLELEITEKTVMDNVEKAAAILESLKATGVQLSIDHFGMGYTAISYLKYFPIQILKIDPSFIKGIPHKQNDLAIINAFIALAHNLGLEIVAEGVETAEQVHYLAEQHCDTIQGYFVSHPVPAAKIILQFKKLREEVLG